MNTNRQIVNKAGTIETSVVTSGLLQPFQAKKCLQQTFDATPLSGKRDQNLNVRTQSKRILRET